MFMSFSYTYSNYILQSPAPIVDVKPLMTLPMPTIHKKMCSDYPSIHEMYTKHGLLGISKWSNVWTDHWGTGGSVP